MVTQREHAECYARYIMAERSPFPLFFIDAAQTALHSCVARAEARVQLSNTAAVGDWFLWLGSTWSFLAFWRNLSKRDANNVCFFQLKNLLLNLLICHEPEAMTWSCFLKSSDIHFKGTWNRTRRLFGIFAWWWTSWVNFIVSCFFWLACRYVELNAQHVVSVVHLFESVCSTLASCKKSLNTFIDSSKNKRHAHTCRLQTLWARRHLAQLVQN